MSAEAAPVVAKPAAKQKKQSSSTWKNLLAGGVAGGVEAMIMYPTEFVKTQLQLQSNQPDQIVDGKAVKVAPKYKGVFDCARQTVAERGPLSLYKGVSTLIVGSIPKTAVRFAAYSQLKKALADEKGNVTLVNNALAGLGAGLVEACIAVTPTETIKTKLIADANQPVPRYRGLIHGTTTMVREGGLRAIYAGLVPTMMKQGGNQAARFTVYELFKSAVSQRTEWQSWHATVGGVIAGGVSVYATMPFDVVKTKMQSLNARQLYKSSLHCASTVFKNDGVIAFWRGTTPRLGRVMCSGGITFTAYEFVMTQILQVWPDPVVVSKKAMT